MAIEDVLAQGRPLCHRTPQAIIVQRLDLFLYKHRLGVILKAHGDLTINDPLRAGFNNL